MYLKAFDWITGMPHQLCPTLTSGTRMSFFDRRLRPARIPAAAWKDATGSGCSRAQYRASRYRAARSAKARPDPPPTLSTSCLGMSKVTGYSTSRQSSCKMQSCKMQVIRQRRIRSIGALGQRPILSRAEESTAKCMSLRFMHGCEMQPTLT